MHGLWIAVSAGEGKPDISKGTNPLIAERNQEKPENPCKRGKEFKPRFIVRARPFCYSERRHSTR